MNCKNRRLDATSIHPFPQPPREEQEERFLFDSSAQDLGTFRSDSILDWANKKS